ncbi:hypothetical protein V5O48_008574 [Marasmius crinis-equi]|uniref:DUF6535 domain-containing protein n=1 Tax=Marasmius crinis-equi TaxID=585013 RepID=A0ABR3FDM7_9AGAR
MSPKQQGVDQTNEKGPKLDDSWEEVMKRVEKIDDGLGQGWKEDIDTLLVFAGLFSAVVTAFTIESYQWLSDDPADTTITILNQISRQLDGQNITISDENPPFTPSSSVIRINTFWFLSLILSLVDALLGLMFKQWLREYRRPTNTQTPEQWLALRCFRSESLEQWHVPSFLAALPIILEVALFLFFAGLLELLWTLHRIPFACAIAVTGAAVLFYIVTSLLPGIDIIRLALCIHPEIQGVSSKQYPYKTPSEWKRALLNLPRINSLCPYKSPQAWSTFQLLAWLVKSLPVCRTAISYHLKRRFYSGGSGSLDISSVIKRIYNPDSWSSADLEIVQHFSKVVTCPDMYALKAYRWLVREFWDSPAMIPHLQTLLNEVPPHLIMPTTFGFEIVRIDRDWLADDVERVLRRGPQPGDSDWQFEYSDMNIRSLFFHNMWIQRRNLWVESLAFIPDSDMVSYLPWNGRRAPLTRILQLVAGSADEQDLVENYMKDIMANNKIDPHRDHDWSGIQRWLPHSVEALTTVSLDDWLHRGVLYQFLVWSYKGLVQRPKFMFLTFAKLYGFIDTFDAFRIGHGLPINFFEAVPGSFPISMDRLSLLLCDSSAATMSLGRELLEEYKRVWDTHKTFHSSDSQADDLLEYLTNYILARIPRDRWEGHVQDVTLPRRMAEIPENPTNDIPHILTSEDGLSLLSYSELSTEWANYDSDILEEWRSALRCVAYINGKPLDYFAEPKNQGA